MGRLPEQIARVKMCPSKSLSLGEYCLGDADLQYTFICPNCSGHFSIQLDRIPPVQARFRCPHCKEPMDFPSREEARLYIRLRTERGAGSAARTTPSDGEGAVAPGEGVRFRIEKPGFQSDVFDRRGLRNLIRTGDLIETDHIRVGESGPVPAGDLPFLKSLFNLSRTQTVRPPACCRTHTDKMAFFRCHDTGRPLCEKCAEEKKFGGQTLRVCQHCGGTAEDLVPA